MVPGIYMLAKLLFKRTDISAALTLLFTFDFMHFAQTRIATIDSFPVLFILWMFYFMLRYLYMSFYHESLAKTLLQLFLSGVFMGLACASKWIGIYAAFGLAALLFYTLYRRLREYIEAKRLLAAPQGKGDEARRALCAEVTRKFPTYTAVTLACCVVFFIVIPLVIYIGSYYQYMFRPGDPHTLKDVWDAQKYMLTYHVGVKEPHPFESNWYAWPIMIRPIWYFMGEYLPEGMVSTINSFGNPIVWWGGLAAFIWLACRVILGAGSKDKRMLFVLIGLAAQFLPWVMVPRTTFIYHYFASVVFITMAIGFVLEHFSAQGGWKAKLYIPAVAVAIVLFVWFYPVISGHMVSNAWADTTKWLPSWVLFRRG
jgi:dolichyl-phosphate-mannose--protein O-mannosyl transferase